MSLIRKLRSVLTLIAFALLTPAISYGQEAEEKLFGFLEMVNLISLKTPTYFTFGGYEIAGGESIASGESSGYSTIKAGSYSFTVSNAGAKPSKAEGEIAIRHQRNSKIIFYDEVRELEDGSKEHRLRHTILTEAEEGAGARLTLVSLLNEEFSSARINGKSGPGDGRKPFVFPVKTGDEIVIEAAGSQMDSFEIDEEIHFLCFLFTNPETGKAELSVVRNEKLEYHPPLEEKKDEDD